MAPPLDEEAGSPEGTCLLRLVDDASGAPISNALTALGQYAGHQVLLPPDAAWLSADDAGRLVVPEDWRHGAVFAAAADYPLQATTAAPDGDTLRATLRRGLVIAGIVRLPSGVPSPGVLVALEGGGTAGRPRVHVDAGGRARAGVAAVRLATVHGGTPLPLATTDADGGFVLRFAPPEPEEIALYGLLGEPLARVPYRGCEDRYLIELADATVVDVRPVLASSAPTARDPDWTPWFAVSPAAGPRSDGPRARGLAASAPLAVDWTGSRFTTGVGAFSIDCIDPRVERRDVPPEAALRGGILVVSRELTLRGEGGYRYATLTLPRGPGHHGLESIRVIARPQQSVHFDLFPAEVVDASTGTFRAALRWEEIAEWGLASISRGAVTGLAAPTPTGDRANAPSCVLRGGGVRLSPAPGVELVSLSLEDALGNLVPTGFFRAAVDSKWVRFTGRALCDGPEQALVIGLPAGLWRFTASIRHAGATEVHDSLHAIEVGDGAVTDLRIAAE